VRTREAFLAGLWDDRIVYYEGERVDDVVTHPVLSVCAQHASRAFGEAPSGVEQSDWIVTDGDRQSSGYYRIPHSTEDLLARARVIEGETRSHLAQFNIVKAVGSDAMCALSALRDELDGAAEYDAASNIDSFIERVRDEDLATVLAQTDPRGDRSLRPGDQSNQNAYLRVVETRPDGIVVRGAKLHTTSTPFADEVIVLPTRALQEGEEEFAVSFAIPVATPGLLAICRPVRERLDRFDNPVSASAFEIETTTIFDDVLVPWDRVFLHGRTGHAGRLARTFATYHRFTGLSYKPPLADYLLGVASLIARDNGLRGRAIVDSKLAEIVNYVSVIRGCRTASAVECVSWPSGEVMPNPVLVNAGKHYFAANFHRIAELAQDIAGGLTVTAPAAADFKNQDLRAHLDVALAGETLSAVERVAVFNVLRDLTASELGGYNYVASLHGEGSLSAQLLTALSDYDVAACEAEVLHAARSAVVAAGLAGESTAGAGR
jgi:aromatic ring hydroxylase